MALKARLPTNTPGTNAPMIGRFLFVTAAMFFLPEKPRMLVGSDFPQNRPVAPGIVGGLEVHKRPLSRHEVMKRFVGPVG